MMPHVRSLLVLDSSTVEDQTSLHLLLQVSIIMCIIHLLVTAMLFPCMQVVLRIVLIPRKKMQLLLPKLRPIAAM